MKVLRIINSLDMGGAERSIETNVPIHISRGYDMDVLLLNGKETPFFNNLIKKQVKIFFTSKKLSIYNPLHIVKIIPYLRKYDIVHVHLFPAFYWVAFARMLIFSKTKLIYTEHSTENRRRSNLILKYVDRIVYHQYEKIISISDATTSNLKKHLNNKCDISTIYNGVDLSPFSNQNIHFTRSTIDLPKNAFVIIQIANFRESKDQDTVIRSLTLMPENCHLLLVGMGKREKVCQTLSNTIGVADRVHFLGARTDIPDLIAISDVVVMSSHYEGFGRAAIEGMAAKKPVIATNVPGLSDIVQGAGLLFEVGDPTTLSRLIINLLEDKIYYQNIATACLERAKKFDVQIMIEKYERIYESIIEK